MTNIKSSTPKYKIIGEHIINDILSKKYDIGSSLPTEKELCELFSVSRYTTREALRYVATSGLIERRQGSGSSVLRNSMPESINKVVSNVNDLLQHGNDTIFNIIDLKRIELSETQAKLLNAQKQQTAIQIKGLRIEPHDKKPVCFTNIYRLQQQGSIDEGLSNIDIAVKSVTKVLAAKNIGKVEQTIAACLMPKELVTLLNAETNSAALKITRRYFAKNQTDLILVATSFYAEHRFSYSTVLYPE
jgi:DNA-binding GntR family transcriptional regulator